MRSGRVWSRVQFVRTKAVDFAERKRESMLGLICGSFGKRESNEGERESWKLGGSLKE